MNHGGILLLIAVSVALVIPALQYFKDRQAGESVAVEAAAISELLEEHLRERVPFESPTANLPTPPNWQTLMHTAEEPQPTDPPSSTATGGGFFLRKEVEAFREQKHREGIWKTALSPPLNLKARDLPRQGVNLGWSHNPRNTKLIEAISSDPLLAFDYRIYRWTRGEAPREIAALPASDSAFVDTELAPFTQTYMYCVLAAVEGRVGSVTTTLESSRSEVIEVETSERFEIRVVKKVPGGVVLAVRLRGPGPSTEREFLVTENDPIGKAVEISAGVTVNFTTGLTLVAIHEKSEEKRVAVNRPVFEPDGSRTVSGENGDPVFESVMTSFVVRHIEVDCRDRDGQIRRYRGAPGAPEPVR